jgi:hypothetical protein
MPTERCRLGEPIVKPILTDTDTGLASRLVDHIDAMPTPMATRDTLRLTIEAQAYVTQAKLTHKSLLAAWSTKRHGDCTLYASVGGGTIRG